MEKVKKDKWYVPDEFKGMKNKGVTQIVIGLVITIFGFIDPKQGIPFILGGIVWTVVGICLVVSKYVEEGKEIDRLIAEKKKAKNRAKNKVTKEKKENDEEDDSL